MSTLNSVPEPITFAKKISVEEYNKQKDDYTQKALKELNDQMKHLPPIIKKSSISLSLPNSDNDEDDKDINDKYINSKDINDTYINSKDINMKDINNDNDSDSDYNDNHDNHEHSKSNHSVNFIIKHFVSENSEPVQQSLKKRKIVRNTANQNQNTTMSDAIYAQHELDMNTITKLTVQNNSLKIENQDLDSRKHYLTLELSNAQCDISDLKKQISYLKNENIKLKHFINIIKKSDAYVEKCIKFICYICILIILLIIYYIYL